MKLVELVKSGYTPGNKELKELMYALHEALVDSPIYLWLEPNFEDMGDVVARAMRCIENDDLDREEARREMERRFCEGRSIVEE